MAEIKFKATRRMYSAGYRELEKYGDLQYDQDPNSGDGVWLWVEQPTRVMIDCNRSGVYSLRFDGSHVAVNELYLTDTRQNTEPESELIP